MSLSITVTNTVTEAGVSESVVLVGAAHRAGEKNVRLEVARPQRNVARVLGLLGVGADLNIRES